MKFAFYALTDFQLLNILKFVLADCEGSKGNSDLFLGDNLKDVQRKKADIEALGLFANIYVAHTLPFSKNERVRKVVSMLHSVDMSLFGKLLTKDAKTETKKRKYEIGVVAGAALQLQFFWNYFRPGRLYLIEDGAGTYGGNIVNSTFGSARQKLSGILPYKPRFEKLYVNNKDYCKSTVDAQICQIPQPDEKAFNEAAVQVFQNNVFHDTYQKNDVIYLQQPFRDERAAIEEELIDQIGAYMGDKMIIRRHPAMKNDPRPGFRLDTDHDMWELVSSKCLSENTVLLAYFSTAQMTPKLLFDKEPYVVFLYKVYWDKYAPRYEQSFLDLKKLYRDSDKVFVPESMEELKAYLEKLDV